MLYQKPENYVRDFINSVLARINGNVKREEVTIEGFRLFVDYQYGKVLIEAKAPGKREAGRKQLINYMKAFGFRFGLLIDIPNERYYKEYLNPYEGNVGFELYLENNCIYERSFNRDEIDYASKELEFLLKILNKLRIATIEPSPENILSRVKNIVDKWERKLVLELDNISNRISIYRSIWRRNMELLYGKDVLESIGRDLDKLFIELTIYTAFLKILGYTILESILGGGRYTIPLRLLQEGYKAAIKLFWEREALTRFNINYIFERDEYDWIFSPEIAEDIDEFFRDLGKELAEIDWSKPIGLDLLKKIYQNIVDTSLRRQLGEFYTPDWLAKLIIWRSLYILVHGKAPPKVFSENIDSEIVELIDLFYKEKKEIPSFIDPTCGSFTFGIHYIDALLKWYNTKRPNIHPIDFAYKILHNVVGIDLNPVAVITAKVNYLLQIHRLLMIYGNYLYEEPIIPIYRVDLTFIHEANSIRRSRVKDLFYYLSSDQQKMMFYIPLDNIEVNRQILNMFTKEEIIISEKELDRYYIQLRIPRSLIQKIGEDLIKLHRAFIGLQIRGIKGFEDETGIVLNMDEKKALETIIRVVRILEKYGVDNIWYSMLINHILAFLIANNKFDLVLGNLPWVNVSKYPKQYGKKLRKIAKELGVNPPREAAKKLDISIILYAISTKYLLRQGGIIGLMVPTSIFRGLHGSAWRSFILDEGLKVYEVFDLEDIQPFENTRNQPGIVIAKR